MKSPDQRFQEIYREHERSILAYCLRRVDRDAALDCAAETFLVAWRRIEDVPDGSATLRWLYRTAHNVIGNYYRKRDRQRSHTTSLEPASLERQSAQAAAESEGPETLVVRRERDEEVIAAVRRLRDTDQQVLLLSAWEGLSHAEIAEVVGCTPHAVDQRVHRATQRLGRELTSHPRSRRRLHGTRGEEVLDVDS